MSAVATAVLVLPTTQHARSPALVGHYPAQGAGELRNATISERTRTHLRFVRTGDPLGAAPWAIPLDQLRGMSFMECNFRRANLCDLDFTGCRFRDCDLRETNYYDITLTGVLYTSGTQWPAGFDPEAHGARLDE